MFIFVLVSLVTSSSTDGGIQLPTDMVDSVRRCTETLARMFLSSDEALELFAAAAPSAPAAAAAGGGGGGSHSISRLYMPVLTLLQTGLQRGEREEKEELMRVLRELKDSVAYCHHEAAKKRWLCPTVMEVTEEMIDELMAKTLEEEEMMKRLKEVKRKFKEVPKGWTMEKAAKYEAATEEAKKDLEELKRKYEEIKEELIEMEREVEEREGRNEIGEEMKTRIIGAIEEVEHFQIVREELEAHLTQANKLFDMLKKHKRVSRQTVGNRTF